MFIKRLIFSALFCFACVYYTPVFADDSSDAVTTPDSANQTNEVSEEDAELLAIANNVMLNEEDQEIVKLESFLTSMGWEDSAQEHRKNIFEKINGLKEALKQNTEALEENYQNMKDKETSFENRMLGAVGMGTVGIGGMMAASALAEQNADKKAEQDMQAYLSSFTCRYGGQSVSGGQTGVELPGGNQLINLYTEYTTLANDLKERKTALGLKPGIESELVLDKASNGLYDDVGKGIESGAYASISRALQDPSGKDAEKLAEQKESTDKKLKIGATVAAAGAVATAAANYAINHNNKDKSAELLAQRDQIQSDLTNILQFEMDECNAQIQEAKDKAKDLKASKNAKQYSDYISLVEGLEFLTEPDDIYKLKDHPICQ